MGKTYSCTARRKVFIQIEALGEMEISLSNRIQLFFLANRMKTKIIPLAYFFVFGLFTSGCAFTKSTVVIDFKPHPEANKVNISQSIMVTQLQDQRGTDPNLLANKGIEIKTSGAYVTEKPIATIVTDAIKETLVVLNYKVTAGNGDLILSGDLLRLDSTPLEGFWSGELDCTIQVSLKLQEKETGKQIWSEVFTGFGKMTGLQIDSESHRKETTEAALADLTNKLANSSSFRDAIQMK
ncbi:MAG TPA: hypothetical protein VHG71_13125 [Verrucomicrobiae bacterium]|nr:hypothetical protein [Verrucomicrobiae bacterium]